MIDIIQLICFAKDLKSVASYKNNAQSHIKTGLYIILTLCLFTKTLFYNFF